MARHRSVNTINITKKHGYWKIIRFVVFCREIINIMTGAFSKVSEASKFHFMTVQLLPCRETKPVNNLITEYSNSQRQEDNGITDSNHFITCCYCEVGF